MRFIKFTAIEKPTSLCKELMAKYSITAIAKWEDTGKILNKDGNLLPANTKSEIDRADDILLHPKKDCLIGRSRGKDLWYAWGHMAADKFLVVNLEKLGMEKIAAGNSEFNDSQAIWTQTHGKIKAWVYRVNQTGSFGGEAYQFRIYDTTQRKLLLESYAKTLPLAKKAVFDFFAGKTVSASTREVTVVSKAGKEYKIQSNSDKRWEVYRDKDGTIFGQTLWNDHKFVEIDLSKDDSHYSIMFGSPEWGAMYNLIKDAEDLNEFGMLDPKAVSNKTKGTPTIEDWSITTLSPYSPPEAGACLKGTVKDHPKFTDGDPIRTSALKTFNYTTKIAKTGNTTYRLGKPDPKFLEWLKKEGKKIEDYKIGG